MSDGSASGMMPKPDALQVKNPQFIHDLISHLQNAPNGDLATALTVFRSNGSPPSPTDSQVSEPELDKDNTWSMGMKQYFCYDIEVIGQSSKSFSKKESNAIIAAFKEKVGMKEGENGCLSVGKRRILSPTKNEAWLQKFFVPVQTILSENGMLGTKPLSAYYPKVFHGTKGGKPAKEWLRFEDFEEVDMDTDARNQVRNDPWKESNTD
jgi:hypothetical protein